MFARMNLFEFPKMKYEEFIHRRHVHHKHNKQTCLITAVAITRNSFMTTRSCFNVLQLSSDFQLHIMFLVLQFHIVFHGTVCDWSKTLISKQLHFSFFLANHIKTKLCFK
uniref:Uncharacterized protein n=1 Tax=Octactis speculum TaxID=3111310 RepID=A0A7S2APM2_9STRA